MADSLGIAILKNLCHHREKILIVVGLLATLLLLTLVGFTVLTPGTATYTLNVFNLMGLSSMLALSLILLVVCFTTDFRYR